MLSDAIPTEIELVIGYGSYVLMLPHIEAIYPIGNTLNIEARQLSGSELSFVTLSHQSTGTEVTIDPDLTTAGTYELKIESLDLNSSVQSILKTETFTITIFDSPSNF